MEEFSQRWLCMTETPRVSEIRSRIDEVEKDPYRLGLMYGFLIAGRISEVVGRACPSDIKTTPRGPMGNDFEVNQARVNDVDYEAVILHIKTGKRGGTPRRCALPLDPEYEPWAKPILEYFQTFDAKDHVFPYTRQDIFPTSKKVFDGLVYPIEDYKVTLINKVEYELLIEEIPPQLRHLVKVPDHLRETELVKRHLRNFRLHALRHARLMDLAEFYQFTRDDRERYAGHTMATSDRYSHLEWWSYFPKLLRKRSYG